MTDDAFLHEFGMAMRHLGQCEIHEILYVEVDPTKPKGCPKCNALLEESSNENNS